MLLNFGENFVVTETTDRDRQNEEDPKHEKIVNDAIFIFSKGYRAYCITRYKLKLVPACETTNQKIEEKEKPHTAQPNFNKRANYFQKGNDNLD